MQGITQHRDITANGNFYNYTLSDSELTEYEGLYTGHAGHSVVTYNSTSGKFQTYEFYAQWKTLKRILKVCKDK